MLTNETASCTMRSHDVTDILADLRPDKEQASSLSEHCKVPLAATGCVKLDIESTADDHLDGSQADGRSYKVQLVPSAQMALRRYPQHWLQVTSLPCTLLLLVVSQALPPCTQSFHLPELS